MIKSIYGIANHLKIELYHCLQKAKELHKKDLKDSFGNVYIPYALTRKFKNAKYETKWQYVFRMNKISCGLESGE